MSVSTTRPTWFTKLSTREQKIVLNAESDAVKAYTSGADSFTLQVSMTEYVFWGKVMTAISEAGWEFTLLSPADHNGNAFAVFKRLPS